MNSNDIDNPDLILKYFVTVDELQKYLQQITGHPFRFVFDIQDVLKLSEPLGCWAHYVKLNEPEFSLKISIYGINFPIADCIKLCHLLNTEIVTDYDPTLKPHEWQLIKPDGTKEIIILEETETGEIKQLPN